LPRPWKKSLRTRRAVAHVTLPRWTFAAKLVPDARNVPHERLATAGPGTTTSSPDTTSAPMARRGSFLPVGIVAAIRALKPPMFPFRYPGAGPSQQRDRLRPSSSRPSAAHPLNKPPIPPIRWHTDPAADRPLRRPRDGHLSAPTHGPLRCQGFLRNPILSMPCLRRSRWGRASDRAWPAMRLTWPLAPAFPVRHRHVCGNTKAASPVCDRVPTFDLVAAHGAERSRLRRGCLGVQERPAPRADCFERRAAAPHAVRPLGVTRSFRRIS